MSYPDQKFSKSKLFGPMASKTPLRLNASILTIIVPEFYLRVDEVMYSKTLYDILINLTATRWASSFASISTVIARHDDSVLFLAE